eukprot:CAMPEP_0174374008 /NCGR_PEP_ID=MMETSP0811_2-20130205/109268_1 /TAXON_ID=73025 ORGANISM="Eutreptiella gymnastica-like, Strain CCMP1594" /NCGR_SAMPLE_ID=MMETSP0811_2 /ASSEMBLY_ACC=CAM_ASM_000667 /LENGTH=63 /DNA_ID=CAMNT_0015522919 /DNA_START=108 /DNA_END=299 /DNA_ORIENTATION=+
MLPVPSQAPRPMAGHGVATRIERLDQVVFCPKRPQAWQHGTGGVFPTMFLATSPKFGFFLVTV